MANRRMSRINNLLREEIAELLAREVKDEALHSALISITEVDTSPDLRAAKVYFSVYGDEGSIELAQRHLRHAAGFLRHELRGRLDLRHTPQLEFVFDQSIARGDRIMRLIRGIEHDRAREDGDR